MRQVFIRHAFRYWMGRNETLDDSPTLIAADKAYVESGGSMKALVASLLSSDSFLYRKGLGNVRIQIATQSLNFCGKMTA